MWRPLLWLTWPLLRCASSPLLTVEVRPEDAAWADAMHPASNFGSICWRWGFNATRCDEHLALWTRVHRRARARSRLVDAETCECACECACESECEDGRTPNSSTLDTRRFFAAIAARRETGGGGVCAGGSSPLCSSTIVVLSR